MRSKLIAPVLTLAIAACSPTPKAIVAHPAVLTCPPPPTPPASLIQEPLVKQFLPN